MSYIQRKLGRGSVLALTDEAIHRIRKMGIDSAFANKNSDQYLSLFAKDDKGNSVAHGLVVLGNDTDLKWLAKNVGYLKNKEGVTVAKLAYEHAGPEAKVEIFQDCSHLLRD